MNIGKYEFNSLEQAQTKIELNEQKSDFKVI